jgi:multiple antibiotic resistance protein
MNGLVASRLISEFLFGFGAQFAIINPYGLAFVFLDKTMSLSEGERARVALRVASYALGVLPYDKTRRSIQPSWRFF